MRNASIKKLALALVFFGSVGLQAKDLADSVPGEFVVKLKKHVKLKSLNALGDTKWVSKKHKLVLVQREIMELRESAIDQIENSKWVEYAEPNYIYTRHRTPNDPEYTNLWGLANNGQKDSGGTNGVDGVDVDAERAWDMQTGNQELLIAVIDTGVDYTLADLQGNIWKNEAELNGEEGVDDDGNGFVDDIYGYDFANNDADPLDDHGHGSHVAGTIAGRGDDEAGIVGVAWQAKIMGIKFLSGSGSGTLANAIKAIDYATLMGAKIMNNSWGGGGFSQALKESIERSAEADSLFAAAAGNSSADNDERANYPSNYEVENVIAVAAIDNQGKLARFSCYGKTTVDLAAPGVNILSITPDGLKSWSGTSMATPHVAGVAALVMSSEPGLSAVEVKERLLRTARPLARLRNRMVSNGTVNAYYALRNEEAPEDPNDPSLWNKMDYSVESAHPYEKDTQQSWEVQVEGASRIAIHFERFETESYYDNVSVSNPEKSNVEKMSGNNTGMYSQVIEGDSAVITLESDGSIQGWGFKVDHISYQ